VALRLHRSSSFPWFHLKEPRWSDAVTIPLLALRKALVPRIDPLQPSALLRQLPADVFLTFGVQSHSATVIASAHAAGVPAALFLGSDGDLDERYLSQADFVSVYRDSAQACRQAIESADQIFCQTPSQQIRLKRFGRTAECIANPIDLEEWDRLRFQIPSDQQRAGLKKYVLWVGRAENEHKRPVDCLALARLCPQVDFLMVMNRRDDAVEAQIRREAPSNVRITERVPFPEMPGLMQQASGLINTSSLEGFPNTFLQAAASGVEVVSLNVESDFLHRSSAGVCAKGSLSAMADQLTRIWKQGRDAAAADQARRYVEEHHGLSRQVARLEESLRACAALKPGSSGIAH
jgi:glycosyltransferase involved in cell wall biosynthesis